MMDLSRFGRFVSLLVAGVCSAASVGCAAAQPKIQRDLETMERESTPAQLVSRGEAFAAVGDMTRAEQYLAAAMRAGGNRDVLTRRLVAVCVADNRYPAALEYAEDYLRKHPGGTDMRFASAAIRRALGDTRGARNELGQLLRAQPNFADAHFVLAQVDRDEGDFMGADAEYRNYLRFAPKGEHVDEARENLLRSTR